MRRLVQFVQYVSSFPRRLLQFLFPPARRPPPVTVARLRLPGTPLIYDFSDTETGVRIGEVGAGSREVVYVRRGRRGHPGAAGGRRRITGAAPPVGTSTRAPTPVVCG